jgi:hypothetical protein
LYDLEACILRIEHEFQVPENTKERKTLESKKGSK